ncbi:MAG TPA: glycosyltransferase family 2 protein [Terriglobales bacterium]
MIYLYWIAGLILALAWLSRIVDAALGMPSVADISTSPWDRKPPDPPRISIIVPARNEEEHVGEALTRLLRLDYENYEVIAVNDRSTDRTGQIMDQIASTPAAYGRLRVIHVSDLPARWLGKAHAMWTAARGSSADWLLFTDADVLFRPDSLRRAIAYAEADRADHLVLFPHMIMKTVGERMMIAFFQALFVFGHRPWKVADPRTKDTMGVGAFNLVRRTVYEQVGTYERLRMEVLDDMKLGKVIKQAGFAQRCAFGDDLISIHWARGAMGVIHNVTKNFYAVLSFQWWRALASSFGLAFLNLLPFVGLCLVGGWARLPYAVAVLSMFSIYVGMSRRSSIPPYYFILHPVSSAMFVYAVLYSMFVTVRRGGVAWRGTFYRLDDLKNGLV